VVKLPITGGINFGFAKSEAKDEKVILRTLKQSRIYGLNLYLINATNEGFFRVT